MEVTVSAEIGRPLEQVAAYTSNPDNDTRWYVRIREVTWLDERPPQVGTRVARVAYFLGRRLAYTYRIERWEPGVELEMRALDGPFPMTTTYRWERLGESRTRMSITNAGGPEGFFGLATPLLARQVRSALVEDLAKLKALLEGDGG